MSDVKRDNKGQVDGIVRCKMYDGRCSKALFIHSSSVSLCRSNSSRLSSRTFVKVSMIARVAAVAFSPFNTVASIYNPRSVNTLVGLRLLSDTFDIKIFDFKSNNSLFVSSNT